MRKLALLIFVSALLAPAISRAQETDGQVLARELGAVLAWRLGPEAVEETCRAQDPAGTEVRQKALKEWLAKNAELIGSVDTRVAAIAPLIFPKSTGAEAVQSVRGQVKQILLEAIFSEKTPEETAAICKSEANPASPRWNNSGMPQVPVSLAALYDWQVKQAAK